jgi:hypothetical protein
MWQFVTCHNLGLSLTMIMDNGDQYFEKKILCPKIFIMPHVKFLIDVWQLMTLTWHHGCSYNGVE